MADGAKILLFARYPVAGQAKTRLIPALGPEGAARLHRRMTEHAVAVARTVDADDDTAVTICHTGGSRRDFRAWLGADLLYRRQPRGDLGERLCGALALAFRSGARCALVVGSDVPGVSSAVLHQAVLALDNHDVVLGPAVDGGYYLLGMKHLHSGLFTGVDWGTERVCMQTRDAIGRMGLTVLELPLLSDVDRPSDLDALRSDPRFSDVFTGRSLLSVIIPTLSEAVALSATLDRLKPADGIEIIVSDGGSRDATCDIGAAGGATVLEVAGGRAVQQNAGAAVAKGRQLLFLHADTLLPAGYADRVRWALDNPGTVAGAFRFRTDEPGPAMRVVEWGTNVRSTVLQWPYGDQSLFMEKRVFSEVGGFAPLCVMEDFDLVRRLRRRGRVVTLRETAVTSGRRWRRLGAWRTTLRNQLMIAGFLAGVSPGRLVRWYRGKGRAPR